MTGKVSSGVRNVAIVGPYLSGKTSFLESVLYVSNAISRKGTIKEGSTVSDSSAEARARQMSVEASAASTVYKDIRFNFLDCPGSVEFAQETYNALMGAGAAIVVCEAEVSRVLTLSPIFKFLDDWEIPHIVFINKMDRSKNSFMDVLNALKTVSSRPLIPHQYPVRKEDDLVGFIDLVTEQAYHYHAGAEADPVPMSEDLKVEEQIARQEMLEELANFDDNLLEELLEEIEPPQEEIEKDLKMELGADLIVPVFMGIAEQDYGIRPLLDALVREAPEPNLTAERRGFKPEGKDPVAQVVKTYYTPQGGKLSLVRVWQGELTDGMSLNGVRVGGMYQMMGQQTQSVQSATAGDLVALARMEGIQTGDTLTATGSKVNIELPKAETLAPVYALAVTTEKRSDEVKISAAIAKLIEEDPSLSWAQDGDTHEIILWGQGEIHLKVALDRLERKYNLPMKTHIPHIPYKETIRQAAEKIHGRYKHQSGGHGMFGDVYLTIKPKNGVKALSLARRLSAGWCPSSISPVWKWGCASPWTRGRWASRWSMWR
jgi:elongation factor G